MLFIQSQNLHNFAVTIINFAFSLFLIGAQLCTGNVFASAGIDVKYVTFVDEQRHFNNIAGVHGSGFAAAGSRIAADARVGFNNSQLNGVRQVNADYTAAVGRCKS